MKLLCGVKHPLFYTFLLERVSISKYIYVYSRSRPTAAVSTLSVNMSRLPPVAIFVLKGEAHVSVHPFNGLASDLGVQIL